jgi:hypothetical protein
MAPAEGPSLAALAGGGATGGTRAAGGGGAIGIGAIGAVTAPVAVAEALPSLPIMKLVPHFGQRIFIPLSGMRRGSNSYGALQETHSTLIIALDQTWLRLRGRRRYADCS